MYELLGTLTPRLTLGLQLGVWARHAQGSSYGGPEAVRWLDRTLRREIAKSLDASPEVL